MGFSLELGVLPYDVDSSGQAVAANLASLPPKPTPNSTNFLVIA